MTNDIIVLLPGIGGSRLERDGKAIYDLSVLARPRLIWNWVGVHIAHGGSVASLTMASWRRSCSTTSSFPDSLASMMTMGFALR